MPKNFKNELEWRGLIQDVSNGFDEEVIRFVVGYIGFDSTSDSLHIGSLVQLIILKHFQQCGQAKPIVLIGGATGMIGDPLENQKKEIYQVQIKLIPIFHQLKNNFQSF